MNEELLNLELARLRARESLRQTAGDGGVYSMDEVLRQLMACYQPLGGTESCSAPQPVAC